MKVTYAIIFSAIIIVLISCKGENNSTSEIEAAYNDRNNQLPATFVKFYKQFHEDSIFQIEHIQFPLAGLAIDTNNQDLSVDTFWQADTWKIHQPFNDYGGTFKREYRNMKGLIIEYIANSTGDFRMERRFLSTSEESYNLIYYAEMRRVLPQ